MEVAALQQQLATASDRAESASTEAARLQSKLDTVNVVVEDLVKSVKGLAEHLDEEQTAPGITESFHDVATSMQAAVEAVSTASAGVKGLVDAQAQVRLACCQQLDEVLTGPMGLSEMSKFLQELQDDALRCARVAA